MIGCERLGPRFRVEVALYVMSGEGFELRFRFGSESRLGQG